LVEAIVLLQIPAQICYFLALRCMGLLSETYTGVLVQRFDVGQHLAQKMMGFLSNMLVYSKLADKEEGISQLKVSRMIKDAAREFQVHSPNMSSVIHCGIEVTLDMEGNKYTKYSKRKSLADRFQRAVGKTSSLSDLMQRLTKDSKKSSRRQDDELECIGAKSFAMASNSDNTSLDNLVELCSPDRKLGFLERFFLPRLLSELRRDTHRESPEESANMESPEESSDCEGTEGLSQAVIQGSDTGNSGPGHGDVTASNHMCSDQVSQLHDRLQDLEATVSKVQSQMLGLETLIHEQVLAKFKEFTELQASGSQAHTQQMKGQEGSCSSSDMMCNGLHSRFAPQVDCTRGLPLAAPVQQNVSKSEQAVNPNHGSSRLEEECVAQMHCRLFRLERLMDEIRGSAGQVHARTKSRGQFCTTISSSEDERTAVCSSGMEPTSLNPLGEFGGRQLDSFITYGSTPGEDRLSRDNTRLSSNSTFGGELSRDSTIWIV